MNQKNYIDFTDYDRTIKGIHEARSFYLTGGYKSFQIDLPLLSVELNDSPYSLPWNH